VARRKDKRNRSGKSRPLLLRLLVGGLKLAVLGIILFVGFLAFVFFSLDDKDPFQIPGRAPGVLIVAEDGTTLIERGSFFGDSARLERLPKHLINAVVAIEDRRFWYHPGIDPISLARAMYVNWRAGRVVQGGSTLTQQLAKNLFLEHKRTFWRKAQEAALALWLEWKLSKEEILSLYLNRVYLGAGAYGVEQAAKRYFGKKPEQLGLGESAIIAGLLKAPSAYNPLRHRQRALQRARVVLAAMADAGYISRQQAKTALKKVRFRPTPLKGEDATGHVADWIMAQLPKLVGEVKESVVVETTINPALQRRAARLLRQMLARNGRKRRVSQGAIVMLGTDGAVKVMIGGRNYTRNAFNRAVQAQRQPGSAFKPFVYLAALEEGFTPVSVIEDAPLKIGDYAPRNHTNRYYGPVTLTTALAKSLNTVAVRLAVRVGPATVAQTAYRLGISSPLDPVPAIALGVSPVSPLELAAAYAPFANGGRLVAPYVVKRVITRSGKVVYERSGSGLGRVVREKHLGMLNYMMRAVIRTGTGRNAAFRGQDIAGKTGTSQKYRDAWFVGYSAHLIAAVWLGNDDNRPMRRVTGGSLPAVLWRQLMQEAHRGLPWKKLPGHYLPPSPPQRPAPPIVAERPDTPPPARHAPREEPRTVLEFLRNLFR